MVLHHLIIWGAYEKDSQNVMKELSIAGFDLERRICRLPDIDSYGHWFFQAVGFQELLLRDFKWNWEPEWKRKKRILMRKYGKKPNRTC